MSVETDRPRRGRPPRELTPDAREYVDFLTRKKRLERDTAMDYAKAVSDGTLTRYVREGCPGLPEDFKNLLELEGEELENVARWWAERGRSGYGRSAAHMSALLEFRGGAGTKTPKKTMRPLSAPQYGLSFPELLDFLESSLSSSLPRWDFRCKALACLADGGEELAWGDWTNVQSPDFRRLRSLVMEPKNSAAAAGRLADGFAGLSAACRAMAMSLVNLRGQELLKYLSRRGIPYGRSVWPLLEALYASRDGAGAGAAFFALCRAVLRDYDAVQLASSANAEPGAALKGADFWGGQLLKDYLSQRPSPFPPELLSDTIPAPADDACRRWRNAAYFLAVLDAARRPAGNSPAEKWTAAADRMRQAGDFWNTHGAELLPLVRREGGLCRSISDSELAGGPEDCLFRIRLLKEQAELELRCAGTTRADSDLRRIYLSRAGHTLGAAVRSLEERVGPESGSVEQLTAEQAEGRPVLLPLLAECLLLSAQERTEGAGMEERLLGPEQVVSIYAAPARAQLTRALAVLGLLLKQSPAETRRLKAKYEAQRSACFDFFFSGSFPLPCGRADGQPFADSSAAAEERDKWLGTPEADVPEIIVRAPRDPDSCPPVFSSCFDSAHSAVGGSEKTAAANQEKEETTLIQTVVSPQIALLQFNQLVDNSSVMKLLNISSVQLVCKKEFIVCSPFGQYETPLDYLYACLKNESYVFSSTDLFTLDGPPEQRELGLEHRRLFLRFLERDPAFRRLDRSDWSGGAWEKAAALAEYYSILGECFPRCPGPNPYRQTRQDSSALSREIGSRLELLLENAGDVKLRALYAEMKKWEDKFRGFNSRSEYLRAIWQEKERLSAGDEFELYALEKLSSLVNVCYNISNGRKSSCIVELTDVDPELQPLADGDGNIRVRGEEGRFLSLRSRMIQEGQSAELVNSNLLDYAVIAHKIALEYKSLTPEQLAALAEREMGFSYEPLAGSVRASGFSYKSSAGKNLTVSSGKAGPSASGGDTHEWHSR